MAQLTLKQAIKQFDDWIGESSCKYPAWCIIRANINRPPAKRRRRLCFLDRGTCSDQYGLGALTGCNALHKCPHKSKTYVYR